MTVTMAEHDVAKRLEARVDRLRQRVARVENQLEHVSALMEDRTFRLARRLALLEGSSPAVQCHDGS